MKIYLAPMEGLTDYTFRNIFAKHYGGIDKYFTPFLSPKEKCTFTKKENYELDPEKNSGLNVVPQFLTNDAEKFIESAKLVSGLGYGEINLNLGCPSGTVTAKDKGSGLLRYPDRLDAFFDKVFNALSGEKTEVSVKTRLGFNDPADFTGILEVYNRYPISELTIHPRVRSDFYKEPVRPEFFEYALKNSKNRVCYNGGICSCGDIDSLYGKYPGDYPVMIGRGIIAKPYLALQYKALQAEKGYVEQEEKNKKTTAAKNNENTEGAVSFKLTKAYHDELFYAYKERLSGDVPLLARMKEFWFYFGQELSDDGKAVKAVLKAKRIEEYLSAVRMLL